VRPRPLCGPARGGHRAGAGDLRARGGAGRDGAPALRRFDLVCFDVDGTLVTHPRDKVIWQILNEKFLGTDHVNEERLDRYRRGEISYPEWVALDIGDWQRAGATRSLILEGVAELTLVGGARATLDAL